MQWLSQFWNWLKGLSPEGWLLVIPIILALWFLFFGQRGLFERLADMIRRIKQRRRKRRVTTEVQVRSTLPWKGRWVERTDKLVEARQKLTSGNLLVIEGPGGSGKTTLALDLAHRLLEVDSRRSSHERDSDVYLWVSAKYRDFTFSAFLDVIALALDYPVISQAVVTSKESLLRNYLSRQKVLLVVDSFETISAYAKEIALFVASLPQSCKVLLTTRRPIEWLIGHTSMYLGGMSKPESIKLVREESNRQGLTYVSSLSEEKLVELHEVTGGMPLAIEWVLGQLREKGQTFDAAIAKLRAAQGDIFEELFGQSWDMLDGRARRVLMAFSAFKESVTKGVLSHVCRISSQAFDQALERLVGLYLVTFTPELDERKQRYSLHPLAYAFARSQADRRIQFLSRISKEAVSHYIDFAKKRFEVKVPGGVAREVEPELPNIFGLLNWCFHAGHMTPAVELTAAIEDLLFILGLFHERISYSEQAADACGVLGDAVRRAHFLTVIAGTLILQGKYVEAEAHLQLALSQAKDADNKPEVARAKRALASLAYRQQDYQRASSILDGVDKLALEGGDIPACIDTLYLRSNLHFMCSRLDQALEDCDLMIRYSNEIGWERAKAYAYDQLGNILALKGQARQADECFDSGIQIAQDYGDRRQIARLRLSKAKLMLRNGDAGKAGALLSDAFETFTRLGMENELAEVQAAIKKLGKWPALLWPIVSRITKPPMQYTDLPLGGD